VTVPLDLRVTVYVIHMARNTDTFLFQKSFEKFCESSPRGAVWVAIEMGSGSVPLQDFVHPPRAVYFLGSEDNGLNRPIVEACHCHVSLPKWVGRSASYNVAAAGTVVMYDRLAKRLREGAFRVGDD
jgi:tRNA G18 (ribose-2'-O)-methylase SpoU